MIANSELLCVFGGVVKCKCFLILPGLVLLLIPNRKVKKAANIILLAAKVLNLYSHFAIDDAFERMAPTLVFFFMLVCRMVVDWQFVNSTQQVIIVIYLLQSRD